MGLSLPFISGDRTYLIKGLNFFYLISYVSYLSPEVKYLFVLNRVMPPIDFNTVITNFHNVLGKTAFSRSDINIMIDNLSKKKKE